MSWGDTPAISDEDDEEVEVCWPILLFPAGGSAWPQLEPWRSWTVPTSLWATDSGSCAGRNPSCCPASRTEPDWPSESARTSLDTSGGTAPPPMRCQCSGTSWQVVRLIILQITLHNSQLYLINGYYWAFLFFSPYFLPWERSQIQSGNRFCYRLENLGPKIWTGSGVDGWTVHMN